MPIVSLECALSKPCKAGLSEEPQALKRDLQGEGTFCRRQSRCEDKDGRDCSISVRAWCTLTCVTYDRSPAATKGAMYRISSLASSYAKSSKGLDISSLKPFGSI